MTFISLSKAIMRTRLAVILSGFLIGPALADAILERDKFANRLGQNQSSFLALDLRTGGRCSLSGSNLETRHAPWSTFKIPNLLIALENGIMESIDVWHDWDPTQRPAEAYWPVAWRQGQTLATAFRRSAAWYFQDIALQVGAREYQNILMAWNYGNADVPARTDDFWLGGPLALSVMEQVRFLEQLLNGHLMVDEAHLAALLQLSQAGPVSSMTLHGKTGSGPVHPGQFSGPFEGWYVGWLMEDDSAAVVFAHHVLGDSFSSIRSFRQDFAVELLRHCQFVDGN